MNSAAIMVHRQGNPAGPGHSLGKATDSIIKPGQRPRYLTAMSPPASWISKHSGAVLHSSADDG